MFWLCYPFVLYSVVRLKQQTKTVKCTCSQFHERQFAQASRNNIFTCYTFHYSPKHFFFCTLWINSVSKRHLHVVVEYRRHISYKSVWHMKSRRWWLSGQISSGCNVHRCTSSVDWYQEDRGSSLLRNSGTYQLNYTASYHGISSSYFRVLRTWSLSYNFNFNYNSNCYFT